MKDELAQPPMLPAFENRSSCDTCPSQSIRHAISAILSKKAKGTVWIPLKQGRPSAEAQAWVPPYLRCLCISSITCFAKSLLPVAW